MSSTHLFATALRQQGHSLTKSRQMVYEALQGKEPLSMHELVATCRSTDRASVYRTITLFESLGIVQRLQIGWKYKLELSDMFHAHHHHATCVVCGRMFVLPEDSNIEKQLHALAARLQFELQKHQVELEGRCSSCRSTAEPIPL